MARQVLATLSSGSLQPQTSARRLCSVQRSARRAFLHVGILGKRKKKEAGKNKQTLTHLRSSCRRWISGNLRCTSTRKSPGCSRRSEHTSGPGSASTRLHLQERKKKKAKDKSFKKKMHLFFFIIVFALMYTRARSQRGQRERGGK